MANGPAALRKDKQDKTSEAPATDEEKKLTRRKLIFLASAASPDPKRKGVAFVLFHIVVCIAT